MAIDKISYNFKTKEERFHVVCDSCGYMQTYETSLGWNDLMQQMKDDKWKSRQITGDWKHICLNCNFKRKDY